MTGRFTVGNRLGSLLPFRTHRIHALPVLVLMPHNTCNCRCVMCRIWQGNANRHELTAGDVEVQLASLRDLKVRWVVLSGGEPLMHSDLWGVCRLLRSANVQRITLLSNGLLLSRHADMAIKNCNEVIVSLDGDREVHDRIRQIPGAYDRLAEGVSLLKASDPAFRITARCVVQKLNYKDLKSVVRAAHEMSLDQVSFLAADQSSTAFGRNASWSEQDGHQVMLDDEDLLVFYEVLTELVANFGEDFASGFIVERVDKLWNIYHYFAALLGKREFPRIRCNAPWVSAVVEADGTVRPCFFHRPIGNIHEHSLDEILNCHDAIGFRRNLRIATDPACRSCVCTLYLGPRAIV